jgi:osomolarity two-component system phosphorelay intermediate protein YPD1
LSRTRLILNLSSMSSPRYPDPDNLDPPRSPDTHPSLKQPSTASPTSDPTLRPRRPSSPPPSPTSPHRSSDPENVTRHADPKSDIKTTGNTELDQVNYHFCDPRICFIHFSDAVTLRWIQPDLTSIIDFGAFSQILEMDEDGDNDFSRELVENYYDQADTTFDEMDDALCEPFLSFFVTRESCLTVSFFRKRARKDLLKLSDRGHYLKGSSATMGLAKVSASCERMQHYGKLRDEEKQCDLAPPEALDMIKRLLLNVKKEYAEAKGYLDKYYAGDRYVVGAVEKYAADLEDDE